MSHKAHFSRFLPSAALRLHFAAHSHHPWPDVSFEAQQRAWLDAAQLIDAKWDRVFGEQIPRAQSHIARLLSLPDPSTICFAPNTHEFVMRLMSAIETRPLRVLTTDSEFHSFSRQLQRLEEAGQCIATRVPVEPFDSFGARFKAAAASGGHALVYCSQVFYNSGFLVRELADIVAAVPDAQTLIVIDGYHGFMALPTDLSGVAHRAFYLAGGYKYAMAGEGVCFMHCPPGSAPRPLDTGWYAGFGHLAQAQAGVPYAADGSRFLGSTFDPSGLYRFNAVMDWLRAEALSPERIHAQVQALQADFLARLDALECAPLRSGDLVPPAGLPRGNFLTFRTPHAAALNAALAARDVITDFRADRLRFGFGVYHEAADVAALVERLHRS